MARFFGGSGGGVKTTVQGDRELIATLSKFRQGEANKIIRKGLRAGAKEIQRETISRSPVRSGRMKKSFKVRAMKRKKGRIGVQVQSGAGFFAGETFYSGFVALGHRIGHRRLGDDRRKVPPNEFMKDAANSAESRAIETLNNAVRQGIKAIPKTVKVRVK